MNTLHRLLKVLLTGGVVLAAVGAFAFKYLDYITYPWTRNGQVRANVIQIAPRVSGPIMQLPIQDNQFVTAGDLLFEIDPRTYQATLNQARANLDQTRDHLKDLEQQVKAAEAALRQSELRIDQADSAVKSAKAELVKAKADFERATRLVVKGGLSQRDFDQDKSAYDVSQARLVQAQSQRIQADAALRQSQAELAQAKASLGAPGDENAQLRAAKAALATAQLNLDLAQYGFRTVRLVTPPRVPREV